jgi:hypothetical protein
MSRPLRLGRYFTLEWPYSMIDRDTIKAELIDLADRLSGLSPNEIKMSLDSIVVKHVYPELYEALIKVNSQEGDLH